MSQKQLLSNMTMVWGRKWSLGAHFLFTKDLISSYLSELKNKYLEVTCHSAWGSACNIDSTIQSI